MNLILILVLSLSSSAMAASHIVGQFNSAGDLAIVIVDDPNVKPYEAGKIWSTITGGSPVKRIRTAPLWLTCYSNSAAISNEPMGACRLVVSGQNLTYQDGYFGALITDPLFSTLFFEGKLTLAEGKLHILTSPQRELFSIKMDESLVSTTDSKNRNLNLSAVK